MLFLANEKSMFEFLPNQNSSTVSTTQNTKEEKKKREKKQIPVSAMGVVQPEAGLFDQLPPELISHIFQLLDRCSLAQAMLVSSTWHSMINQQVMWKNRQASSSSSSSSSTSFATSCSLAWGFFFSIPLLPPLQTLRSSDACVSFRTTSNEPPYPMKSAKSPTNGRTIVLLSNAMLLLLLLLLKCSVQLAWLMVGPASSSPLAALSELENSAGQGNELELLQIITLIRQFILKEGPRLEEQSEEDCNASQLQRSRGTADAVTANQQEKARVVVDDWKQFYRRCLACINLDGLWIGHYGSHGPELVRIVHRGYQVMATKITGMLLLYIHESKDSGSIPSLSVFRQATQTFLLISPHSA